MNNLTAQESAVLGAIAIWAVAGILALTCAGIAALYERFSK